MSASSFRRLSSRLFATARTHEPRLLGLVLLFLHAALWGDFGSLLSRAMMLAHLGLFLLWQPLWRQDLRLDKGSASLFVLLTMGFVAWLNWWFVFFWLLLLVGIIGGRVLFVDRREHLAHMITLVALISELLIACVVELFKVPLTDETRMLFFYGLLAPPLLLLVLPAPRRRPGPAPAVDILQALTISSLTTILALGSLLVMYSTSTPYPVALFQILVFIALFLLAIAWLLNPHPGFSGLAQLWSRYVLNVGTPFEQWLTGLSRVAQAHATAEDFLQAAMLQLVELPWVEGVVWTAAGEQGKAGLQTDHSLAAAAEGIEVTVYTLATPGPTLRLHGKLLVQVIAYFHAAKRAEQELARRAHLQAVYETGARITHDIKNLLQSLHTMTVALASSGPERAAEAQKLVQRRLPHVTQRLQRALDKLQAPEAVSEREQGDAREWWRALAARHEGAGIVFFAELEEPLHGPLECLDTVVENLLENALFKRQSEPDTLIEATLSARGGRASVAVCDTGSPVPTAVAGRLLQEPVDSTSGLGIGLYQAARQAQAAGYALELASNHPGRVCFRLAPAG